MNGVRDLPIKEIMQMVFGQFTRVRRSNKACTKNYTGGCEAQLAERLDIPLETESARLVAVMNTHLESCHESVIGGINGDDRDPRMKT